MEKKIDWLGKEYGPGDLVLYSPRSYGGGCNMHLGEVVRFTAQRVVVRPIASARHGKNRGAFVYIDKRNGNKLKPYEWMNKEHMERDSGFFLEDGTYITYEQFQEYPWSSKPKVIRAPIIWKPYVLKLDILARPVALQVVKNITKWEGTLPEWASQVG